MIQKEYNTYLNIGEVTADSFIVNASISPLTVTNYDVEDFNLVYHPNADIECECTYALLKNKKYDCSFEENGYTYSFVGEVTKCSYNDNSYSVGLHTFSGIDTYFIDDDSSEGDSSDDPDVPTGHVYGFQFTSTTLTGTINEGEDVVDLDALEFVPTIDGEPLENYSSGDACELGNAFVITSYTGDIGPIDANTLYTLNNDGFGPWNQVYSNNQTQTSTTGVYSSTFECTFTNANWDYDTAEEMTQYTKDFYDPWVGATATITVTITDENAINNVQPNE